MKVFIKIGWTLNELTQDTIHAHNLWHKNTYAHAHWEGDTHNSFPWGGGYFWQVERNQARGQSYVNDKWNSSSVKIHGLWIYLYILTSEILCLTLKQKVIKQDQWKSLLLNEWRVIIWCWKISSLSKNEQAIKTA